MNSRTMDGASDGARTEPESFQNHGFGDRFEGTKESGRSQKLSKIMVTGSALCAMDVNKLGDSPRGGSLRGGWTIVKTNHFVFGVHLGTHSDHSRH